MEKRPISEQTLKHRTNRLVENLGDQEWRLNNLYWIINERGERVLFKLNPVQKMLLDNFWYMNIILKSRQHGITTFICILYLDMCLFKKNQRAGIIAHNREDAESFFNDKVKYAYENLPEMLKERIIARSDSARELSFSNNSAIRVGTSMRGSTLNYLHVSEFAIICRKYPDKAKEIVTGSLNTVHAGQYVTIESTAGGREGYFYEFCSEAQKNLLMKNKLTELDFRFHFYAWYLDKRNTIDPTGVIIPSRLMEYFDKLQGVGIYLTPGQKAWYSKKWVVIGQEMFREHPSTVEESFMSTIEGAYFASQFDRIYRENRITTVPYDDGIPVDTCWDLGVNDTTVIWFTQKHGHSVRVIDCYENSGEGLAFYANILRQKKYNYGRHYAPHDIQVRELGSGKSRKEQAYEYGIDFEVTAKLRKEDQIEAARNFLQYCWFDEKNCDKGIKGLETYRKEWDDKIGCYKSSPLHDWSSNFADAFMIGAVANDVHAVTSVAGWTPKRNKVNVVSSSFYPMRSRV
jgi:hypothetical protein